MKFQCSDRVQRDRHQLRMRAEQFLGLDQLLAQQHVLGQPAAQLPSNHTQPSISTMNEPRLRKRTYRAFMQSRSPPAALKMASCESQCWRPSLSTRPRVFHFWTDLPTPYLSDISNASPGHSRANPCTPCIWNSSEPAI